MSLTNGLLMIIASGVLCLVLCVGYITGAVATWMRSGGHRRP
jgi:hypothetical protein